MKSNVKKLALVIASLSLVTLIGCSKQEEKPVEEKTEETAKPESKKEEPKNEDSEEVVKEETTDNEEVVDGDTPVSNEATPSGMKKVGTPEYGYVFVPVDWANFIDITGNDSFQVSKVDKSQIISLNVIEIPSGATLEDGANSVAANMEATGAQGIEGAQVNLKGYDAYQVYGAYNNGTYFVVAWIFEAEDGKVHYIAAEGNNQSVLEAVSLIEEGGWVKE